MGRRDPPTRHTAAQRLRGLPAVHELAATLDAHTRSLWPPRGRRSASVGRRFWLAPTSIA